MPKGYQQLTYEQRCQIDILKARGDSNRAIARQLGVHSRTIDREVARNSGKRGYRHKQAHEKCLARRQRDKGAFRKMTPELIALTEEKLTQYQWSPEQISGWLKRDMALYISHERIYQHVWQDKKDGGTLYQHLRRRAKKYLKRTNGKTTRGRIKGRVDIAERPKIVEERTRLGDWEADTIVGLGHRSAIVTLVERKSRFTKMVRVERATATAVSVAIITALAGFPVKTITFDNGKEFASHLAIAAELKAQTYFATPYHSWERGLNENTNGLIRQYFPKQTDFRQVSDEDVAHVEERLNTRPRKCLGYDTPARVIRRAA